MLPTLAFKLPSEGDWLYEIKYDGFRGILEWRRDGCFLWSRNGKDLLPQFPEIKAFLFERQKAASEFLPLILDGEIVILENEMRANFKQLQTRGRLRSDEKIMLASEARPCKFLAFDLLSTGGKSMVNLPYLERKSKLLSLCKQLDFPLSPTTENDQVIQYVPYIKSLNTLFDNMEAFNSEGIVAKHAKSIWEEGKRTSTWRKIKNWKTISCFITAFDENNGFFYISVWKNDEIYLVGKFINGLNSETKKALFETIKKNYYERKNGLLLIDPGICLDLHYLEWTGEELREPYFKCLRFDLLPEQCTYARFLEAMAKFPAEVTITHPDKLLWRNNAVTKLDYLRYLREISHHILPFLQNRLLTVIRAPHGIFGEAFYQKSRPKTAPEYVSSHRYEENEMIVCNDLKTLIWLGNQLSIEFHIPFQTVNYHTVSEIVFDLDPPSRGEFHLAIKAARLIKEVLDKLSLTSFVKLSGNKGMQIYIPLPENSYSWEDTRIFTEFIANLLISIDPQSFTIERLKKNRNGRLYVDFIQHAQGKTIIAPYSVRNNEEGLVAAPVFWHEVNENLNPTNFTIENVLKRIDVLGNPFYFFFSAKEMQPFDDILQMIKNDELT